MEKLVLYMQYPSIGAIPGQTLYVLTVSAGTVLVPLVGCFILKGLTGLFDRKKPEERAE